MRNHFKKTAMKKNKIVITSNPVNHEGGVVHYYNLIVPKLNEISTDLSVTRMVFGSRMKYYRRTKWVKGVLYPVYFLWDFIRLFFCLICDKRIEAIQVSPSLIPVPLLRDAPVVLLGRLFRKKIVVFFHGWKEHYYQKICQSPWRRFLFLSVFDGVAVTIVLLSKAERQLRELGYRSPIERTTTCFLRDDILPAPDRTNTKPKLLFLGRVDDSKGVGELLKSISLLPEELRRQIELNVVGRGKNAESLQKFQKMAEEYGISDLVNFVGRKDGLEKEEFYANSDIYLLPSHTEGCPTTVMEALANGLYVIATNVGAVPDIIIDPEIGALVPVHDAKQLSEAICNALQRIDSLRKNRENRRQFAIPFELSSCTQFLCGIYHKYLDVSL